MLLRQEVNGSAAAALSGTLHSPLKDPLTQEALTPDPTTLQVTLQLADDKWESSDCDSCDFGCSHPKRGWLCEFPGEGSTHMVVVGLLRFKKPPMSWCKAVTLRLILFLLTLKKVGKAFQLHHNLGCLGSMPRGALVDQDTQEMEPVARAMERPSSGEEMDTVSQATIKES